MQFESVHSKAMCIHSKMVRENGKDSLDECQTMEQTKQQLDAQTALDEEQRREESDWDVPGEEEAEAEGLAKKERLESTRPRLILGRITLIDSSLELKDVVDRSLMKMREDSALHNCFGVDELDHACLPFTQSSFHIRCSEGGEIEISNLNGGVGVETASTWISSSDCQLTAKETISHSPFFVPTLNTSSSKATNGEYTRELTESSTLSFTETAITLAIPQKEIAASIAVEAEWHARLVFGDGSRTESFRVKLSGSDERKALTKQAMKWVVPVICACVSLLLFIVILLRHRS
ncbi:hypothetical protein BLNAU_23857 [Blattamonas nauphoetae]|uniref:Uncharacterized protein n=1 Tax=Blattamonas nauphoetae TaxID=2049346 RepID=A0ABQ9WPJ0_9EUKA|nr:hypothetical protein BLNAU_23857 [Blattamonas nauphoetae]